MCRLAALVAASNASGIAARAAAELSENLAARAKVTASAEYNRSYQIRSPRIHETGGRAAIRNLTPEVRLRGVAVNSNGPRGPCQTPYPVPP